MSNPDDRDENGLNAYDRKLDRALDDAFEKAGIDPTEMYVSSITSDFGDSGVIFEEVPVVYTQILINAEGGEVSREVFEGDVPWAPAPWDPEEP